MKRGDLLIFKEREFEEQIAMSASAYDGKKIISF